MSNQKTPAPPSPIAKFFFSESGVTVKALFDNIRNYLISATLFTIAIVVGRRLEFGSPEPLEKIMVHAGYFACWLLAIVSLLLNLGQSLVMLFTALETAILRIESRPGSRLAQLVLFAVVMGVTAATLLLSFSLFLVLAVNFIIGILHPNGISRGSLGL